MENVVWFILAIWALSRIGHFFNHRKAVQDLEAAARDKDRAEMELKVRKVEAIEGKVAKAELRKQIKLIESVLPLKELSRENLKKMPPEAVRAIVESTGLDADVIAAYLNMPDVEIARIKLGL